MGTIGVGYEDDRRTKTQKLMLVFMAGLMGLGAVCFAIILFAVRLPNQSLIPIGYILITLLNLTAFNDSKNLRLHGNLQIFLSLVLPFALQAWLGGLMASGILCLWSPIALMGSVIIFGGRGMMNWVLTFIGLTLLSVIFNPFLETLRPEIITPTTSLYLLAFNILALVSLISGLSMSNLGRERKMRKRLYDTLDELQESNATLEAQQEEIAAQTEDIQYQARLMGKQNDKINQSITYAKRIQSAVLPQLKEMCSVFSESMLLYIPRDQVGGDFYWCSDQGEKFVVVAADCTGHGVPGAFLSLLGSSMLDTIVNDGEEYDPGTILSKLDDRLAKLLRQQGQEVTRGYVADGMDMSVCVFEEGQPHFEFAGALQSLYHIHKGELVEVKGSKFPVGDQTRYKRKAFDTHRVAIAPGDVVYLSSDGYKDQFGGPENKKFLSKTFKGLLQEVHSLPMAMQKRELLTRLQMWKGDRPQTDDILVMGMRF